VSFEIGSISIEDGGTTHLYLLFESEHLGALLCKVVAELVERSLPSHMILMLRDEGRLEVRATHEK
jgi:hypothetical protein